MTVLYSQIIELENLGISDCVLIVDAPRNPAGGDYVWDGGIDADLTTRLRWNSYHQWFEGATYLNDDSIACAAANSAAGSTTCQIYLYPYAIIPSLVRHGSDMDNTYSRDTYGEFVCNLIDKTYVRRKKVVGDDFTKNQFIYFNAETYKLTDTATRNVSVGASLYAAATSATDALVTINSSFAEAKINPSVQASSLVAKVSGYGGITTANSALAQDISGNYFRMTDNVYGHGTFDDVYCSHVPDTSASRVYAVITENNKMWSSYKHLMLSLQKADQNCLLVPQFGAFQAIRNSISQKIWGSGDNIYQETYDYKYKLRPYKVLKSFGFDPNANNSWTNLKDFYNLSHRPYLAIPIPASITWTPVTSLVGTAPGAVDMSSTHWLIYGTNNPQTYPVSLMWDIYAKNMEDTTYPTDVIANGCTKNVYNSSYSTYLPLVKNEEGRTDIINPFFEKNNWLYYPDENFTLSVGTFSSDGSDHMTYRVVTYDLSGGIVALSDWADMSKSTFHTIDTITYSKHTFSGSLADYGVTDGQRRLNRYRLQMRLYHSMVSPYHSLVCDWLEASQFFNGSNSAGNEYSYDYRRYHNPCFHYTLLPQRLSCSNGNVLTTEYVEGRHLPANNPAISWSGGVTVETDVVAGKPLLRKVRVTSTLTPSVADTSDLQTVAGGFPRIRIRRRSDGRCLHTFLTAATTNGCIWSNKMIIGVIPSASASYGTGVYAQYLTNVVTQYAYVDIAPDATDDETYDVEVYVTGTFGYVNKMKPYNSVAVRTDSFTIAAV